MDKKKKRFFTNHSKSSAALVSLGIHAVLIVVALSFVAVTVINKPEQTFDAVKVKRPKMALKKLQVPVKIKKKKVQQPKLRKRIVSTPKNKSMDIRMPEISGIKGGMGYMDGGGGLGGIGFSLDLNLFGKNKGTGNELEGTFFDLKMKPDGSPAKMDKNYYNDVLKEFCNSWNIRRFENDYFKAPKKRFATTFMLPFMDANEAPKAFAVEDVVQPKQWVAYYNGKIAAPESGEYRFWGIADDVLMVRIKGDLVIDANYQKGKISDWKSDDERNRKLKASQKEKELVIGDWFHLTKGRPTDMEVLLGERPGGRFYCTLLIEQDGVDYPRGADGLPILPIFKTQQVPGKLMEKMQIEPGTCTTEGPSYGVLN